MNSKNLKKSIRSLSLCLITAFALASCASSNSRDVAQVTTIDQKNDVAKIEDGQYPPHKFHAKRFEEYNEKY
jgi:hypothetical protein